MREYHMAVDACDVSQVIKQWSMDYPDGPFYFKQDLTLESFGLFC